MKNIILGFSLAVVIILSGCDRNKKTVEPIPPANATPGPIPGQVYSNLQANILVSDYGNNSIITDSSAFAAFYLNPPGPSGLPTYVDVGTVSLNSTTLALQANNQYSSFNSSPVNVTTALNWNVAGSGTVSAFTHALPAVFPYYNGASLPDTCVKANGISINVSGASNFTGTGFTVLLSQSPALTYKHTMNASGVVTFAASELSAFNTNTPLFIQVSFNNYTTAVYGGVKHGFSNLFTYNKKSYLK